LILDFMFRAWSSAACLFPGLHPDGFEDADSGWPCGGLRRIFECPTFSDTNCTNWH